MLGAILGSVASLLRNCSHTPRFPYGGLARILPSLPRPPVQSLPVQATCIGTLCRCLLPLLGSELLVGQVLHPLGLPESSPEPSLDKVSHWTLLVGQGRPFHWDQDRVKGKTPPGSILPLWPHCSWDNINDDWIEACGQQLFKRLYCPGGVTHPKKFKKRLKKCPT